MPKISVVMSVYNGEKYLRESVESILNQTLADLEFIIINDGSTDDTLDILEEYSKKDSRIKIVDQKNMGLTKSLNKGIALSNADYIARQDVDDVSLPSRLEAEYLCLENDKGIDLVGSWYFIIDEYGHQLLARRLPGGKNVKKLLKYQNFICHSSVMFRRNHFYTVGEYNEKFKFGQDTDLWRRMGRIEILPLMLLKYRWIADNITVMRLTQKMCSQNTSTLRQGVLRRCLSSLLIEQGEKNRAREMLQQEPRTFRTFFYYALTFLPKFIIDIYMWRIRFFLKRIFKLSLSPFAEGRK